VTAPNAIPENPGAAATRPGPDRQPVLVVTGGSRGIGAATAWLCAQRGHAVAVN
jgi:NADP-dependent 3-hydroxy acid dehydrogenase YdfG